MHRPALAAALLLSLRAPLGAQPADTVSLRFGWPVGMTARVEQDWSRVQSAPARHDSTHVRSAYRLRVVAHPRGRLVQTDSFRILAVGNAAGPVTSGPEGQDPQQFLARLGSFLPSYVVSEEGEFIAIEGMDRMRAALDSLFAPMRATLDSAPPQLKAILANATSPEALTASAAQEWNLVAGTWVGADWELGEVYGLSSEEPIPFLPGRTVPMNYEFSAAERVACTAGEQEARCVRLEMRSAPDSAALQALLKDLLGTLMPAQRGAIEALRNMRTENALTVIADPRTLKPYATELVKFVEVVVPPSDGDAGGTTTRIDTRSARYSYPP